MSETLGFFRMYPDVKIPERATEGAAAFDIRAYIRPEKPPYTYIQPGERVLLDTGLILDIPEGYHVKMYARSGLSFTTGLIMTNSVGIIDSDYVHELRVSVTNIDSTQVTVKKFDRVAQAMLVKNEQYELREIFDAPTQKTDRKGGFGSTGTA